jgi:hypothetical protein
MSSFGVCSAENFGYSLLTVFLVVVFIGFLRVVAGVNKTPLGPELNLLTYGFLVDVVMKALRGQPYWEHYSRPWTLGLQYKATFLFLIALLNFILMMWNIKVAEPKAVKVKCEGEEKEVLVKPTLLRSAFSALLGLASLLTYFVCQSCWEA